MCKKKKLDKIGALLVIANAQKPTQKNFKRRELRLYWCNKCQAYHTTKRYKSDEFKKDFLDHIEVIDNIHDKARQKQALIDMMREDEELGLYNE